MYEQALQERELVQFGGRALTRKGVAHSQTPRWRRADPMQDRCVAYVYFVIKYGDGSGTDPQKRRGDGGVPPDVRPSFLVFLRHVPMYYSEGCFEDVPRTRRRRLFYVFRVVSVLCVLVADDTHAPMVVHSAASLYATRRKRVHL